jgi:uncharacterized protein (UPF0335 family)
MQRLLASKLDQSTGAAASASGCQQVGKITGDWNRRVNISATFAAIAFAPVTERHGMTDTVGIPGNRILSFIERIEHIDEELKALNEGKKEVFSEAKGEGFDVKVLKEILHLRKQDQDERDEQESMLDLYLRAIQDAAPAQAKAA